VHLFSGQTFLLIVKDKYSIDCQQIPDELYKNPRAASCRGRTDNACPRCSRATSAPPLQVAVPIVYPHRFAFSFSPVLYHSLHIVQYRSRSLPVSASYATWPRPTSRPCAYVHTHTHTDPPLISDRPRTHTAWTNHLSYNIVVHAQPQEEEE